LRIANITRDAQLLQHVREIARQVVEADPEGIAPHHAMMWARLRQMRKTDVNWSDIS